MRIIVTGGTGFIGRALVNELVDNGHGVTVLTRNAVKARTLLPSSATGLLAQKAYGRRYLKVLKP